MKPPASGPSHLLCPSARPAPARLPSREYALLSLAGHHWQAGHQTTTWYRIIVWNLDCHGHLPVLLCRTGDKVRITGRPTIFTTRDGRTIEQIELHSPEIIRGKAPEIP